MKIKETVSRRKFLATTAATVGASVVPAFALNAVAQTSKASAVSSKRVLHIIGYPHIDASWLWPWRDGSDEVLNTFRSALERMK